MELVGSYTICCEMTTCMADRESPILHRRARTSFEVDSAHCNLQGAEVAFPLVDDDPSDFSNAPMALVENVLNRG